jgi:hypothetical protein
VAFLHWSLLFVLSGDVLAQVMSISLSFGRSFAEPGQLVQPRKRFGGHQLNRPITCMNAGTSMRTSVASTSTAGVSPRPNIRMNDTCAAVNAANEIDMISAAAVMTRPVCASPGATLSSLSTRVWLDAGQYSRIRDTRNTS